MDLYGSLRYNTRTEVERPMKVCIASVVLFAVSALAQAPADREQTLTLGQVTISTYNPVTVSGLENSTNLYFTMKNQSNRALTVELTSWQELQASLPDWILHLFK